MLLLDKKRLCDEWRRHWRWRRPRFSRGGQRFARPSHNLGASTAACAAARSTRKRCEVGAHAGPGRVGLQAADDDQAENSLAHGESGSQYANEPRAAGRRDHGGASGWLRRCSGRGRVAFGPIGRRAGRILIETPSDRLRARCRCGGDHVGSRCCMPRRVALLESYVCIVRTRRQIRPLRPQSGALHSGNTDEHCEKAHRRSTLLRRARSLVARPGARTAPCRSHPDGRLLAFLRTLTKMTRKMGRGLGAVQKGDGRPSPRGRGV